MFEGSSILILPVETKIAIRGIIDSFVDTTLNARSSRFIRGVAAETIVNCVIYSKNSGQIFLEASVKDMVYGHLSLKDVRVMKEVQQRDEVRYDVRVPVRVQKIVVKGNTLNLDKPIQMYTRNVSACGIMLNSKLELPLDIEFYLYLRLSEDTPPISLVAKAVRKIDSDEGNGYNYGCRISTMGQSGANVIRKFIFACQINERRKIKNEIPIT